MLEVRVSTIPEGTKNRGEYVESFTRRLCFKHLGWYTTALKFGRQPQRPKEVNT